MGVTSSNWVGSEEEFGAPGRGNNWTQQSSSERAELRQKRAYMSCLCFFPHPVVLGYLRESFRALLGNSAVHSVLRNNQKEESEAVLWGVDLNKDIHLFPVQLPSALSVVVYPQDRKNCCKKA